MIVTPIEAQIEAQIEAHVEKGSRQRPQHCAERVPGLRLAGFDGARCGWKPWPLLPQ
jgi:hypothetical protein